MNLLCHLTQNTDNEKRKLATNFSIFRKINKMQLFELHITLNKTDISQKKRNFYLIYNSFDNEFMNE